jgi:hypothetical protein
MALIIVGSLAADFRLEEESLARALLSAILFALGLVGLFVAQVWAFVLIAPHCDHLSAKDLVLSGRLWSLTFRRLPETRKQVWLGGWGVTALLSAVFVIGGYSYWYQFYKPKKYADKNLIAAIVNAAKRDIKDKSLEEALQDLADTQDLTKKKDDKAKAIKEDKRATVDCVIIGYTVETDKDGRKEVINSLVLATLLDNRLKYVGQVRQGVDERAAVELLKRLAPLVQDQPFLPGLKLRATWVKPSVFCAVHQSGFDRDGRLLEPRFKEMLTSK